MSTGPKDAKEIFLATIEKETSQDRSDFLVEACAGDNELRRRVDELLISFEQANRFLENKPAALFSPTVSHQIITEKPGDMIGPYKLREQIGEGGMGLVFVAEQIAPVRRKVALKLVKPGMDTKQVIARFEAERQALALMDHTNIAKVLDAGATETGRPYFVMELVRGIAITEYCDKHNLTTRERLELFISVCRAVQHAHQKGIIHRDIKPGNVLVTQIDGKPVPKVIDFGVAKAVNQQLTEQSIYTQFAETIGTPLYMSPEQAEMSNVDVDTRSDIYSLGVVLYELLTGNTPFDRESLKQANPVERMRIIREDEPPKPSARISTLNAADLSTISGHRSIVATKLKHAIRGELDWIVMRAMEKDRNRRYESANALAADIERFLIDQPVLAGPPSVRYRLRKFAGRNRVQLLTSAAIVMVVASVAGFFALDRKSQREDRETRRIELVQQIDEALTEAQQFRQQAAGGDLAAWMKARQMAERAETLAESELVNGSTKDRVLALLTAMAEEEMDRRVVTNLDAARIVGFSVDIKANNFQPHFAIPEYEKVFLDYGFDPKHLAPMQAVARINSRPPNIQTALLAGLDTWVDLLIRFKTLSEIDGKRTKPSREKIEWLNAVVHQIDTDSTRMTIRQTVQKRDFKTLVTQSESIVVAEHPPYFLVYLATHLWNSKKKSASVELLRQSRKHYPSDFFLNAELGKALASIEPSQLEESIRFSTVASALRPENVGVLLNLSVALMWKGRHDEAIVTFHQIIRMKPDYAAAYKSLGDAYWGKGDRNGRIVNYLKAHEHSPELFIDALQELATDLRKSGHSQDVLAHCRKLIQENPNKAIHHYQLGRFHAWEEAHPAAISAYREAINLDSDDAETHNSLSVSLLEEEQLDAAISAIRRAIDLGGPDLALYYHNLSIVLTAKDDFDGAIAAFRKSIQLKPDDARFINHFAWLLATSRDAQFRDPQQAVDLATTATKKDKRNAAYWNTLGVAQYRAENYVAAVEALQKSNQLGNDDFAAIDYFFLAMATLRLGNEPGAQKWLEKGVMWVQTHKLDNFNMIEKEDLQRFHTEAEELLATLTVANIRKLIKENPNEASYRYQLGLFLASEKDWDSAIASIQKAIDLNPDYTVAKKYLGGIHKNQGDILWQTGDWDAAITAYIKACQQDPLHIESLKQVGSNLEKAAENKADHKRIKKPLAKLAEWWLVRAESLKHDRDERFNFVLNLSGLSKIQLRIGDDDEAFRTFSGALNLWERLAGEYPEKLEINGAKLLHSIWTFRNRFLTAQETSLRRVLQLRTVSENAKANLYTVQLIRALIFVSLAMEKSTEANALAKQLESLSKRLSLQFPEEESYTRTANISRRCSFAIAATCRDPKFFNPARARALAMNGVRIMPSQSDSWEELAVARYMSEDWQGAINALVKSPTLPTTRLRFRELIFACAYTRLGRAEDARNRYAKAIGSPHHPGPRTLYYTTYFLREYDRLNGKSTQDAKNEIEQKKLPLVAPRPRAITKKSNQRKHK